MRKIGILLGPPHHSDRRTGQAAALILKPTQLCKGFEGRHVAERERLGEEMRRGHASSSTSSGARAGTERARPRQGRRSSTALRVTPTKKRKCARSGPPSALSLPAQTQAVACEAVAPTPFSLHRDQPLRQREEREAAPVARSGEARKTEFRHRLFLQEGSEGGRVVRVGVRSAN